MFSLSGFFYHFIVIVRMKPKSKKAKKRERAQKAVVRKEKKNEIMDWLEPYLESTDNSEADEMWNQLKIAGQGMGEQERGWENFKRVIQEKWISQGRHEEVTQCLNSGHCKDIWSRVKHLRGDTYDDDHKEGDDDDTSSSGSSTPKVKKVKYVKFKYILYKKFQGEILEIVN